MGRKDNEAQGPIQYGGRETGHLDLFSFWLPQEGCDSSMGSRCAGNACGWPLRYPMRICDSPAHREFCQASLDGSQNPAYYRVPLSLQLAHRLHLLAAQGRPKMLAEAEPDVLVGPHFKDGSRG